MHIDLFFQRIRFLKRWGFRLGVTLFGTVFSMFITALMAYGLSRRDVDGRKVYHVSRRVYDVVSVAA